MQGMWDSPGLALERLPVQCRMTSCIRWTGICMERAQMHELPDLSSATSALTCLHLSRSDLRSIVHGTVNHGA